LDDNYHLIICFQPTNKPITVNIKTSATVNPSNTHLVTALEDAPDVRPGVSLNFNKLPNGAQVQVSTKYALTTIQIGN